MKHSQVLKRAWHILWQYRALWVFGIILAITTASIGSQSNYQFSGNDNQPSNPSREMNLDPNQPLWPQVFDEMNKGWQEAKTEFNRLLSPDNPIQWERDLLRFAIGFTIVMLVLYFIGKILRYVVEVALVKMVDIFEETGEKLKARQGWRLGWSRQAWRIFLIDLIIYLPMFVVFVLFMVMALSPILTVAAGMPVQGVVGLVASIGLIMLFSLLALVVLAVVSLVKPVIIRKIVLEDMSTGPAFREGFRMFRHAWKEYGLMWLILKGIDIVWPLAMFPFVLLTGAIGLLFGGGFAFLLGGDAIQSGDPAMMWPIILGVFLLVIVVGVPLAFLTGLRETFKSTSWTLTYREIKAISSLENGDTPMLEAQPAG